MSQTRMDAFVFFGATGDLGHKKIFPALQALAKRGELGIPVICVAKDNWTLDQLMARVRDAEGFERPAAAFSYGWAQIPDDASDHEELMATADRRLYEAKGRR